MNCTVPNLTAVRCLVDDTRWHANHVFETCFEVKFQKKVLGLWNGIFSEQYGTFICDIYWE